MNLGIILIIIAAILFILEVIIPGFFIGVVATAILILGIIGLAVGDDILTSGWAILILLGGAVLGMVVSILLYKRLGKVTKPVTSGGDRLVGKTGIITVSTDPERPTHGKVRLESEMWSAEADTTLPKGTRVTVTESIGAHVKVEKIRKKGAGKR